MLAVPLKPRAVLHNSAYLAIFDDETQIREMSLNITLLKKLGEEGLIISARGKEVDFVSRFFVPGAGIDEDPATGFAHTLLIPYWSELLKKKKLHALQVSSRGGEIFCEDLDSRVNISGRAVEYLSGHINI